MLKKINDEQKSSISLKIAEIFQSHVLECRDIHLSEFIDSLKSDIDKEYARERVEKEKDTRAYKPHR